MVIELGVTDHELVGEVTDDGRGFDVARALDRRAMRLHMGLDSMRARLELTGGRLDIESAPDRGASIRFRIPSGRGS